MALEEELREMTKARELNIEFVDNSEMREVSTRHDIWRDFWRVSLNVPGSETWRILGEASTRDESIKKAIQDLKSKPGFLDDLQKGVVRQGEYFRYGIG